MHGYRTFAVRIEKTLGVNYVDTVQSEYRTHVENIKKALYNGKAVLFVGAGLSKNAEPVNMDVTSRFESWDELMLRLAKHLWPDLESSTLPSKIHGQHLMVAQQYIEAFGHENFYQEVLQAIPNTEFEPGEIHRKLVRLPWKAFVTTNQDDLLERALKSELLPHEVVVDDVDIPLKEREPKVFKIHGSIERPASLVFSEEQYRTYPITHPLMFTVLKAIFAEYLVIFIGFSLTDPNFKAIHGWVRDVLGRDHQRRAYAFVFQNDMDNHLQRYWEKRNVILLPVAVSGMESPTAFSTAISPYLEILKRSSDDDEKQNLELLLASWQKNTVALVRILNQRPFIAPDSDHLLHFFYMRNMEALRKDVVKYARLLHALSNWVPSALDLLLETRSSVDLPFSRDQLLLERAWQWLASAEYTEASAICEGLLDSTTTESVHQNEARFLLATIAWSRLDWAFCQSMVSQIDSDLTSPLWASRLAALQGYLDPIQGEHLVRSSYQDSASRSDDWQRFVSAKAMTAIGSMDARVREELTRIEGKLQQSRHARWLTLQMMEARVQGLWDQHRDEASRIIPGTYHIDGFARASYEASHALLTFFAQNGLPYQSMSTSIRTALIDSCVQLERYEEACAWAIMFGDSNALKSILHFETIEKYPPDMFDALYNLSRRMFTYLSMRKPNSLTWINRVFLLWGLLLPASGNERLQEIGESTIEYIMTADPRSIEGLDGSIMQVLEALAFLDTDFGEKLVDPVCRLLEKRPKLSNYIQGTIASSIRKQFPDSLVKILVEHNKRLVWLLMRHRLISQHAESMVFDVVFGDDSPSTDKLMFAGLFKDKLSADEQKSLVKIGFDELANSVAKWRITWVTNFLGGLTDLAETLNKSDGVRVLEATRGLLSLAPPSGLLWPPYERRELALAYLRLLSRFVELNYHPQSMLAQEFVAMAPYWTDGMSGVITNLEGEWPDVDAALRKAMTHADPEFRRRATLLSGVWLSSRLHWSANLKQLFDTVVAGINDSNLVVASECIRAVANIYQNHKDEVLVHIDNITYIIESHLESGSVRYLTHVAMLYRRIAGQEPNREGIKLVIDGLGNSAFANVRREVGLQDERFTEMR